MELHSTNPRKHLRLTVNIMVFGVLTVLTAVAYKHGRAATAVFFGFFALQRGMVAALEEYWR